VAIGVETVVVTVVGVYRDDRARRRVDRRGLVRRPGVEGRVERVLRDRDVRRDVDDAADLEHTLRTRSA
jgi:hypothetical protein